MIMKIKYIKDESLAILKNNQKTIFDIISRSSDKTWLDQLLGEDYLVDSKIDVNNLVFDTSKTNAIETDIINSKMIYTELKKINETQAIDERLWAGIALSNGYDYMLYRWGMDQETKLRYRWFFYTENRRKLFFHGIARLWWYAHLSYDPELSNPFELTEYAFNNPQILENLIYRNISSSKVITHSIIRAVMNFEKDGGKPGKIILNKLYKEISIIGGVSILDAFDEIELQKLIYTLLFKIESNL